ncbi:hypothetical protein [Pseudomonas sp. JG-B]|uniref:hypothetical protein n=1 Tax=Pseudomonas sp. JG-B TaxID=2603214 RepID=UPI0021157741|nr:hypothetical protein [Pseudomonas sp. JG-B]
MKSLNYFIIPTVKEKKQQADTVNTIRALSALGVPKKKILLVFNKVEVDEEVRSEFASMFGLAELEKSFTLKPEAVIYANEVYERLKTVGKSLSDVVTDETDYRQKLRDTADAAEKEHCVKMVALKRLAVTATKNLDDVHRALFGK